MPQVVAPIELVPYDSRWPRLFEEESAALRPVISEWLVAPIEHIGSTAVPGLVAKPIIDLMAPVGTLEESKDAIRRLEEFGYLYAPYRTDVEHWFCKPRPSFRTHHLHLVPIGSPSWMACIRFRDRLRTDQGIADEYARLKVSLARAFENDREAYTEGKAEFVARIVGQS